MPQQVLDIELAGVLLNRPRRKCVTKPVSVDIGDAGPFADPTEHVLESVRPERDIAPEPAVAVSGHEETTRLVPTG